MPKRSKFQKLFRDHVFVILGWLIWIILQIKGHKFGPADSLAVLAAGSALTFCTMLGCVFAVVRHADQLAELMDEPYGTLVLTLSATAIEVSLMLMVMAGGAQNPSMLRDTIFATLMVVLNGMVGVSLVSGGWINVEQSFNLRGALSFLHLIAPLSLLLLVLPNYTSSTDGPTLAPVQGAFLGMLCLLVYGVFLIIQTGRHRSYFANMSAVLDEDPETNGNTAPRLRPRRSAIVRASFHLLAALLPIILLAEHLGSVIDLAIEESHTPPALGGLVVAALVLLPEGVGAQRAAALNLMQRAVNICLGSALATIGLTVPIILLAASLQRHSLTLGLSGAEETLLYATLLVSVMTFVSGFANVLQGVVHLMLFVAYLFLVFVP
ncbi:MULTISPECIES: calcium:proton antiporter [Methylococcus]|uniref:Calcium/proton transporter n=1 Tax=Methylococcus capsulatus TaxID=414 RepID=A0ABZ2F637_METCP|nr:calcium/proton transporter [Methylococcus capsulatus]MDF9393479.1 calcium/proton transporter [Methylococcus capsulatus]